MKRLTTVIISFTLVLGANAYGAMEVIVNGGFETGGLAPWQTSFGKFSVTEDYSHTGRYVACLNYYDPLGGSVMDTLSQELPFSVSPEEVVSISLYAECLSGEIYLWIRPGLNQSICYEFENGAWFYLDYPKYFLTNPFQNINITTQIYTVDHWVFGAVDDISILVTLTGVEPTSLGRVKALFK